MLKAALDVHYRQDRAKAVCLLFAEWTATQPEAVHTVETGKPDDYEPGQFYKRELPCLLEVLKAVNLAQIELLIVDGYVFLDDKKKPGLGAHLHNALPLSIPVVGVAKRPFHKNENHVAAIRRGSSRQPLYVTAVGTDLREAATLVQNMAGEHRIPTLLRQLDRLTRQ